jgi:murein DD-endopeptidase MepM/ murein hydrolase activator NlpD
MTNIPGIRGPSISTLAHRSVGTIVLTLMLMISMGLATAGAVPTTGLERLLPVDGSIVNGFSPPEKKWQAGHRGVDLAGATDMPVRAAAAGTVTWVGRIAGVDSISVTHADGLRTTYLPVTASVSEGDQVAVGQTIGSLQAGHCAETCLHWGLLRGEEYLDPMDWLSTPSTGTVALLPRDTKVKHPAPDGWDGVMGAGARAINPSGTAVMPADGPMTSPFGSRTNPVTGASEVHDGLDIGAPCGAPVRAAWSGTVRYAAVMSGFGNRMEIDHGNQPNAAPVSAYNHMSDAGVGMVHVGDQVQAGQVIGLVGTTGLSTGCHLHFSTFVGGQAVDPRPFI